MAENPRQSVFHSSAVLYAREIHSREVQKRMSYTDVVMKLFNAFGIGVVVAAAALALIYRREVREMVLPIIRNLW